ncbi:MULTISPECIES: 2-hydroxycarboxylate transporter family protein [Sporosarcina]|uniref:2-hydroxycarboxylate transporter family protein n=1 Tax=Sporosarcina TaxID=1569 RepID=UPI00129ABF8E|nr:MULTISPECIES: 2-hydroxycarboxylate transporter family protein [Sporosarcina]GKV64487.1 citrate:sodium symporter [Sporosarcina sp. NCCP-2331]GLB57519.1 citrate:sodium symporter [Sporosarcina sp. NCCP-2378]
MANAADTKKTLEIDANPLLSQKVTIFNLPIGWFLGFSAIAIASMYMGVLPPGLIGALLIMIVLGELLGFIGDHTPIVKSLLGGGAIVAIFGSSYLAYSGLMPAGTVESISEFMKAGDFLNFYIAALITGSILGMNSKVLVQAGVRYALPLLAGIAGAIILAALVGALVGFSLQDSVLVMTLPIMGGGLGAGAVPMAQVYSELLGKDTSYYMSLLIPALALGNVFAIIFAAGLNALGNKFPSLTGNGQLIKGFTYEQPVLKADFSKMGVGLVAAASFYMIGTILGEFIPIHPYAIMIIVVAAVKAANLLPAYIEESASQWYQFVSKNFTLALLIGVGVVYTDLGAILSALSIQYVFIVMGVVLGAIIGAGFVGKLVGFYPIEAAITAGLCMANMGGTGDVAVLSAAKRMELMPFAQISSRLGGALIILLAGLLVNIFV